MTEVYQPEGFYVTTLSQAINASTTSIPVTAVPSRVTKGFAVIEPASATKREVIHFTSVGATSVTAADDTTDASDASGRGCVGSITPGANTTHDQGVTVIIAATEQYWDRLIDGLAGIMSLTTGVLKSESLYAADAGANDDYAITLSPAPTAYVIGMTVVFKANTANTGASTLAVNGLTAKPIKKLYNQALDTGDILAGQIATVIYDGTNFQLQSVSRKPTVVGIMVVDPATDCATGDGKAYFRVPLELNGMNLTGVAMTVYTAGTTGTQDVQLRNKTDSVDMLSTKMTIDSTETDTSTAATPAVIDATKDDVATGDVIAIDVDAVQTTKAKGLYIEMRFELP